ncbi:serine/threonine protein kinase [Pendulispora brunnea]|uniref:non-specific serine/threonine protein kinase n=2 Tax=Pendulispora brunnea TaxID=2905690 RepID=A0ABZ2KMI2_9BACT
MATVYLAISRGLGGFNKLVVLKQLRSDIAGDPEFLPMLLEEARIAARINHPNVVQTNDIGFDGRAHYIAMEYLEGQTLHDITRRLSEQGRRLPLPLYLHILAQALRGLHFAHELAGFDGTPLAIVHRDMTPHNVFVTYEGVVKVLDFGIAKAADSKNETRSGTFKGKLRYIAPEQALGIPIDRRADIFAIGAMMWHALAGSRLWKDVAETDVLMQLAKGDIPSIAEVAPSTPPDLLAICQRALARRPEERFATAAEMMEALETHTAHVQPRELSQFVSQLFEERRAIVRAAIDQRVREGLSGTEIPVLATGHSAVTNSGPSIPSLSGARALPSSPSNTASGSSHSSSSRGSTSPFASHPARASTPPSPIRRHAVGAIFGVAAAVLGFTAYKMVGPSSSAANKAPAPVAVASAAPSAVPPPAKPAADKAHLRVTVTPATANIRLDGTSFSGDGQVTRDGASHRLEIDAPGFKPESDYVVFDRDELAMAYTLAKKDAPSRGPSRSKSKSTPSASAATPAAPEPAPSATQSAAAAAPSSTAPATRKRQPKTSLDSADPWK